MIQLFVTQDNELILSQSYFIICAMYLKKLNELIFFFQNYSPYIQY